MAIVAGFDVHRAQITFDALDRETGEVRRGRISATPEAVCEWAGRFAGEIHVAVEAGTGWLFVCEALREAGAVPHLAEPAEARTRTALLFATAIDVRCRFRDIPAAGRLCAERPASGCVRQPCAEFAHPGVHPPT
jgi:hypothetical protein